MAKRDDVETSATPSAPLTATQALARLRANMAPYVAECRAAGAHPQLVMLAVAEASLDTHDEVASALLRPHAEAARAEVEAQLAANGVKLCTACGAVLVDARCEAPYCNERGAH